MKNTIWIETLALYAGVAATLLAGCCTCNHVTDNVVTIGTAQSKYLTTRQDTIPLFSASGRQIGVIKMAHNKNYCRPIDGGKRIDYAPVNLPPYSGAPTEEQYNDAGWFRYAVQPPVIPEGKVLASTTYVYDEEENAVVAVYTYEDAPPPALEDFDMAMEQYLREEREARGYTTREPDAYLTSEVPRWAQDAKDWVAHRDAVMEYALELINAVEKGERLPPTMEEFIAIMPKIQWTYTAE